MSRRGRRSRETIVGPSETPFTSLASLLRPFPLNALTEIEDRRTWHPDGPYRAARQLSGHPVRPVTVKQAPRKSGPVYVSPFVKFDVPKRVVICVRRKQRKEVLHALKKVGRGRGGGAKRRNWYSSVSC